MYLSLNDESNWDVDRITGGDVREPHRRRFTSCCIACVVAGDVDCSDGFDTGLNLTDVSFVGVYILDKDDDDDDGDINSL